MALTGKSKALAIRGLMLDPARLVERHEFYFDMLPKLADWGFNTLWWHLADDEGFVLKLDRHPELATPYAFSKPKMRRLIAAAGKLGIEVVPEVESLGHARYITRLPQYAHLADGDQARFNAICPSHGDTIRLLRQIIEEVADLFGSQYFHAGMDEANLSGCRRCAARAAGKPKWRVYLEHVKAVHRIVMGCGKRMIVWADHVEHSPAMLRELPKDILLCHWQYGSIDAKAMRRSLAAGHQVIGAPSMLRFGNVIQPGSRQATNTEGMIAAARPLARRGMLGVVNTWWTGWRVLRDSCLPMAAYTGHLLGGGTDDKVAFFGRYCRNEFGLGRKAAGEAIWTLHREALRLGELQSLLYDSLGDLAEAIRLTYGEGFQTRVEAAERAAATVAAAAPRVKRNRDAFNACVLAGQLTAGLLRSGLDVRHAHETFRHAEYLKDRGYDPKTVAEHLDTAAGILSAMCRRGDSFCKRLSAEWDRTRYAGDIKKAVRGIDQPCPVDSLLGRMVRSRAFLKRLTETLVRQAAAYRRGGEFPAGL